MFMYIYVYMYILGGFPCPHDCDAHYYLAGLCTNNFHLDCGKFHAHCGVCDYKLADTSEHSLCLGDYRMAHCGYGQPNEGCGHHFWMGLMGSNCPKCHWPGYGLSDEENLTW